MRLSLRRGMCSVEATTKLCRTHHRGSAYVLLVVDLQPVENWPCGLPEWLYPLRLTELELTSFP